MFSLSPAEEWKADINLKAETMAGTQIGETTIPDVPFQRNRVTNYSGSLFTHTETFQLSVENEWNEPYIGT